MSSHFMIWNAQGIANSRTQGTLKNMIDMYSVMFVAVIEPQTDPRPSFYSRRFGLQFGCANISGKIWIFAHRDWHVEVVDDSDQVIHVRVSAAIFPVPIYLSIVYAKCTRGGRYSLWTKLRDISLLTDGLPWLVGGDFNTFLIEEERQGGTAERHGEMMDFADAIADCQLFDPGFDGPSFTWSRNGLWERLDRVLLGEHWTTVFAATRVTHLPRISSDHAPLLVRCQASLQVPRPSFRFQNMWTRHHTFKEEIARAWTADTGFLGMLNLQFKLSRIKSFLKRWHRDVFGNIFEKLREAEEAVTRAQAAYDGDPTATHRVELSRRTAEYVLRTRMEEDFWKQKAAIRWATEGERNSKFFHGWVRQKRVKSRIHVIQEGVQSLTSEEEIRQSAVGFFQQLLTSDTEQLEEPDLEILHRLPESVDRQGLCTVPESVEHCWDIVGADVVAAVEDFFRVSGQMVNREKSHFYLHVKFGSWADTVASVMEPYDYWLNELEQIMARFFWGTVGQQRKIHWVIHQLRTLVAAGVLVPLHWRGCTPDVDFMPFAPPRRRVLRSLSVLWHPPDAPWVKLNTDGAYSTSTGQAGGGGLVRGSDGSLLGAFCTPLVAAFGSSWMRQRWSQCSLPDGWEQRM
ncbi:hypothetical protein AAHA92_19675 [Salvia divinorum]|uniref:Endonuclease/exonuclease/phosphatase domain-containing protein n=1 Tax=Salvia divinorum TaxID=28513 RepID=A0ABD1H644_SALDI